MKRNLFLFCLLALVVLTVNAQQGGFTGPGLQVVTVQQAKSFRDDTPVLLQGKILRFLGDEKYLFADDTGTIIVEIDDRLWRGISVSQDDMVEISGEVDRDYTRIEIEAESIKKL